MSRVRSLLHRKPRGWLPPTARGDAAVWVTGDLVETGVRPSAAPVVEPVAQPAAESAAESAAGPGVEPVPHRVAVHVGGSDLVALSHAFATAGRLHEAALAQWAADLQLVGPHLGHRAAELCSTLESLSPVDPQSALTAARAAISSLVDEGVPVLSLLGPTSHLARPATATATATATGSGPMDDELFVLPRGVEAALNATLRRSAQQAGDRRQVSVTLRRHLLRARCARTVTEEPTRLVRNVLEPHEQHDFDDELARQRP